MPLTINISYEDQKGAAANHVVRIPTTVSLADAQTFAQDFADLTLGVSLARITNISVGLDVDLSAATIKAAAEFTADIFHKVIATFRDAVGRVRNFTIPTIRNTLFPAGSDSYDLTNADVAAWVAATEDGIEVETGVTIQPVASTGQDIVELKAARELFRNYRP